MQTINTYLYQVCHTAERLQLANFHCHLALETGEPQDGVDLLATFIDKKIDGSVLQFLNLHLLIFHENGASLEKLGKAVSALSNLEYLMLTIPPVTKQTHERSPYSHAKIFVLMLLESISSSRLRTVFFMVGAIPKVKDLIFLDWAAIGRALLRPNYANLESIMADCTGNLKADEWADKSVPWLNCSSGLVSVNPSRSGS
ncbi:hypothetical protein DL96DRAFT_1620867 [Flagelloscypha sp. PMI_526]|nr:hypothetical protein DL96DRAFT_1620867 [Flagelloscypha sp. PMI_526]